MKFLLIGCGGLILLFILAILGMRMWWEQNGGGVGAGMRDAELQGARFGMGTDEQGCLDEGIRRGKEAGGLGSTMQATLFTDTCLRYSRETPGFCRMVPPPGEFRRAAAWQQQTCGRDQGCLAVLGPVQEFCNGNRPKAQPGDTLLFSGVPPGDVPAEAPAEAPDSNSF